MKTIAIIGGGFRGVGCLKVLIERGFHVDLYEKYDDIGGVWHPSNNYKGLRIHTPAKLNQFEDFPYPDNIDITERLESKQVYEYLKAYATHFDLFKHMNFNAGVHEIHYDSKTKKSVLVIGDDHHKTAAYDYVINTNGFSDKHIPEFKNADQFKGKIIHSFEANDELIGKLISENKKVTILGAGKTAADLICAIKRLGANLTWLYRTPYYFFRYRLFHDNLRKAISKEPTSFGFKAKLLFGFLLGNMFPKLACHFWRWNNIIDTYGERHTDYRKFHVALVDDGEMDVLKECSKYNGVRGEIDHFEENGYYTNDNRFIEADTVICCTGSSGAKWMSDIYVDGEKLDISTIYKAYRGKVIPQVPNLIFTAYHHFAMGLGDGEIQGKWISNYINADYSEEYLDKHALKFDHPFFQKLILFDSSDYFFPSFMKMQFDFIHNHELGPIEYVAFVYSFFLNAAQAKPLSFKYTPKEEKAKAIEAAVN